MGGKIHERAREMMYPETNIQITNNKIVEIERLNDEKKKTVKKLNKILSEDTKGFIKKCSRCGKPLKYNYQYGICKKCFNKQRYWY